LQEALPERRLLFGHHLPGDRHPDIDVHRAVRRRAHRRLDLAVERDDRGPRPEDRPAAPALQRPDRAALQAAAPQGLAVARSSHRSHGATPGAVERKPRPMPRVVRLGRPANDNSRHTALAARVLVVALATALTMLMLLDWGLI